MKQRQPCASTSSGVHAHADANASRSAATAARDNRTPFGAPVVPLVYKINATASGLGSGYEVDDDAARSTGTTSMPCASSVGKRPSVSNTSVAPESPSTCRRSAGPESGGNGTTGTPANNAPTTPTTVRALAVAATATTSAPAIRSATAVAAANNPDADSAVPSTRTRSAGSPNAPCRAGNSAGEADIGFLRESDGPSWTRADTAAGDPAGLRTARKVSRPLPANRGVDGQ